MQFIGDATIMKGLGPSEWFEIDGEIINRRILAGGLGVVRWLKYDDNGKHGVRDDKLLETLRMSILHDESHNFRMSALFRLFRIWPGLIDILPAIEGLLITLRPLQFAPVSPAKDISRRIEYDFAGVAMIKK